MIDTCVLMRLFQIDKLQTNHLGGCYIESSFILNVKLLRWLQLIPLLLLFNIGYDNIFSITLVNIRWIMFEGNFLRFFYRNIHFSLQLRASSKFYSGWRARPNIILFCLDLINTFLSLTLPLKTKSVDFTLLLILNAQIWRCISLVLDVIFIVVNGVEQARALLY